MKKKDDKLHSIIPMLELALSYYEFSRRQDRIYERRRDHRNTYKKRRIYYEKWREMEIDT